MASVTVLAVDSTGHAPRPLTAQALMGGEENVEVMTMSDRQPGPETVGHRRVLVARQSEEAHGDLRHRR